MYANLFYFFYLIIATLVIFVPLSQLKINLNSYAQKFAKRIHIEIILKWYHGYFFHFYCFLET